MTPNKDYIRNLVKERDWSDSELARQMDVSRSEVNRFLHGKRCGGKKLISGLLKAFPKENIETLFIFPLCTQLATITTKQLLMRVFTD